jgi:2-polyprenyl-6-methoxyphenol hydroxylase-like FAD-dependent oxidoreductase
MYDVVVVGARCAGAPTAMLLARAGYRVLLLEKDRYPRDTLSTNLIHPRGVVRLARWALVDAVEASGCPPIVDGVSAAAGTCVRGWGPAAHGIRAAYAPRRHVLDTILAEAAASAGADFHDGCTVEELLVEDGRVAGVRYRTPNRAAVHARARLVVGADGMRSTVARLAGATAYGAQPRLTCVYYTYWDRGTGPGGGPAAMELYQRTGCAVSAITTHGGQTMVAAYRPQSEFRRVRLDLWANYLQAISSTAPELHDRLAGGGRATERLRGTGAQHNVFRRASGPGWVLVGDAGHHEDSIAAHGITNAFSQAELLADCVDGDLGDTGRLDAALRRFAAERDALLMPAYRVTLMLARLQVPQDAVEFLRTIAASEELTTLYFGLIGGVVPRELFEKAMAANPPAAGTSGAAG